MLAIIPARGGSKGLPGKNIKELKGKPLIAYTIEAALKSKYITRVIVSTDDMEIVKVAKQYGAEVPFIRPSELASDTAKAIDTYQFVCNRLEVEEKFKITNFIVLQPTSPFRTEQHIDSAVDLFKKRKADSVISFCKENHPIYWHKHVSELGEIKSIFPETIKNRQEEKPTFFPNGAIYIFKREIINKGHYYTNSSFAYIMDRKNSVDIDTKEDFEYAEFLLNRRNA